MQPLRIYLIGAGVAATAHAAAIQTLPADETVVLSVADPRPAALAVFVRAYPQARSFTHAADMLAEPASERDIVIVATPPFLHCELTCAALESGRHVLCEKPFALNLQEAYQMLQAAHVNHRLLGCCSSRSLGSPVEGTIRTLLAEGSLGTPYHLRFVDGTQRYRVGFEMQPESAWFLQRSLSSGGVLANLGAYDITFLNAILQPERVDVLAAWMADPVFADPTAKHVPSDVEQHAGATLRYHLSDKTRVMMTYERAAATYGQPLTSMELVGTHGALRWDWFMWVDQARLVFRGEKDGQFVQQEHVFTQPGDVATMYKPLYYFYRRLENLPSSALVNEHAIFNFCCLQALYQYVVSDQCQVVSLSSLFELQQA